MEEGICSMEDVVRGNISLTPNEGNNRLQRHILHFTSSIFHFPSIFLGEDQKKWGPMREPQGSSD